MSVEKVVYKHSITANEKLLDLRLGDIWRFRDLLSLFVYRDFVAVYKQTILGPIWFFIQPLFTTIVFTIIFNKIAKIPTDGLPPMLFYLAGISSWNYFAECFRKTSNSFTDNASLFGKVYFPRVIVPLSVVISNLLTFGIQFLLFLAFIAYYWLNGHPIHVNAYVFLLPFLILLMAFLGLGFGMLVSSLTTKYRDLQFLVAFGIQLAMYSTPVIYPSSSIPQKYQWVIAANPMATIIETFRFAFLGTGNFSWIKLAYTTLFTFVVFIIGLIIFNSTEKNFMDTV